MDLRDMMIWTRRSLLRFTTYCIDRPHLHIEILVFVRGLLGLFSTNIPTSCQLVIVTVGSATLASRCFRIGIVAWSSIWWVMPVVGFDSLWLQRYLEKESYGTWATAKIYALLYVLVYFIDQGALSVVLEELFTIFRSPARNERPYESLISPFTLTVECGVNERPSYPLRIPSVQPLPHSGNHALYYELFDPFLPSRTEYSFESWDHAVQFVESEFQSWRSSPDLTANAYSRLKAFFLQSIKGMLQFELENFDAFHGGRLFVQEGTHVDVECEVGRYDRGRGSDIARGARFENWERFEDRMMSLKLERGQDLQEMVQTMEGELSRLKRLSDSMALVFLGLRASFTGHMITPAEQGSAMARSLPWPAPEPPR